jgi:probable phosphoglycerate mutase
VNAAANDRAEPRNFPQSRFAPPPGACEILMLRHGESAPHVEGEEFPLVDGHGDPPLSEEGRLQAEQAAERLIATGERIAAVYVTTLQRTHQTAAPLVARLGLEPVVEPELREVFLGDWEGGEFRKRLADGDPIAMSMAVKQRWDVIPGAEPEEVFAARVRVGIERIAAAHRDELVVAVVHGGVIGQVIGLATGARGFGFTGADNASISHVVVTPERWIVRCYNDTTHLRSKFSTAPEPLV